MDGTQLSNLGQREARRAACARVRCWRQGQWEAVGKASLGDESVKTIQRASRAALMMAVVVLSLMAPRQGWAAGQASVGTDEKHGAMAGIGEAHGRVAPAPDSVVVLADPEDPFYPLAGEIATAEDAALVDSLEDALARDPEYLLWVTSPSWMSDQAVVDFGLALGARDSVVSVGILSGSTMEDARQLWQRGGDVEGRLVVVANAANPSAHILSNIIALGRGGIGLHPLTLTNLTYYLERADYLTFTGHGAGSHLELDSETWLRPSDIPELSSIVVTTGSCNTFRIWEEGSLALAFADRGAAAYAGFAYSPNEGYLLGEFHGAPLRYTWPGFPVGHVIRLQNKGTVRGFASFPYYHLLGDPRIALQSEPPYELVADSVEGGSRTLSYSGAPEGFIPVRISGGAGYGFVDIPGVASASKSDPFYNARLQTADIGDDKLVLFEHDGGDFTIRLEQQPSLPWLVFDVLSDSLDHTLVYLPPTGGDLIALFLGGLAWLTILRVARRAGEARSRLLASAGTGVVVAALHGAYVWARLDDVTITSKSVEFSLVAVVGTFLVAGAGAFVFLSARSWRGKALALIVGTMVTWVAMLFSLALVVVVNHLLFERELGTDLYNHALGLLPIPTLLAQCGALLICYSLSSHIAARLGRRSPVPATD